MGWLRQLFTRRRRYDELSESIREHLDEKIADLTDRGITRKQAENTARREFGDVTRIEERSREVWQWPRTEAILSDIRFAFRQLRRSPGFAVAAILTLTLGIAINTTMFSMVSTFLFPHLPGRSPGDIVVVSSINPYAQFQPDTNPVSAPTYYALRSDARVFSAMAADDAYRTGSLSGPGQQPESIAYSAISTNYLSVFGVSPILGRGFVSGEDQAGRDHVALLSYGLWNSRYRSDPSIVGRSIRLNREEYTVVGVMPADFHLLGFTPKFWIPLTLTGADQGPQARKNRFLYLFARMVPGISLNQARAEMARLSERAQSDFPETERRWGATVRFLPGFLIYNFGIGPALAIIMTIVGFVLLIACVNVASLQLTQAVSRQKELAIRISLGAGRLRVARQLLIEGMVISFLGGGSGLLLSFFGIQALRAGLNFNDAISAVPIRLDGNVLLFAIAVSLTAAVLCSTAPALRASRTDINTVLKSETRGGTSSREHNRLRAALVGGEIALALFLLTGSCLLIRGVYLIDHQELGFNPDQLVTAGLVLDQSRYPDASHRFQFMQNLIARLQDIPGAQGVAVASDLPATGPGSVEIHIRDQPQTHLDEQHSALDVVVSPDYFSVIGVPLVWGRAFTSHDDNSAPSVVVVNKDFVREYFGGRDPIGEQVKLGLKDASSGWSEIVGVVGNVRGFSEAPHIEPEVYEAYAQRPVSSFSLMIRSNRNPDSLIAILRRMVAQLDPDLPLLRTMSMDKVLQEQRGGNPLFVRLLGSFAALALILSAIGIYGLIAYSVRQRTQEFGIRFALGAKRSDISGMILRQGFKIALVGSIIGFLAALPLPRVFDSVFQGTLPFGAPAIFPIVFSAMLLVALASTLGPAVHASAVNPTSALRNE
ncbi:MAG: ABC transporter permease [Acidobacteriaceae bacterium]